MKYEKFVTVGNYSVSHTIKGTPAEVKEIIEAIGEKDSEEVKKKSAENKSLVSVGLKERLGFVGTEGAETVKPLPTKESREG